MSVILNEVKNLVISNKTIVEILRPSPQNDIAAHSLRGKEAKSVPPGPLLKIKRGPGGVMIKAETITYLEIVPI
jgi:hypothetical protein